MRTKPSVAPFRRVVAAVSLFAPALAASAAEPSLVYDIAAVEPASGEYRRVYGATGNGSLGVPVAGPGDVDGDGHADYAIAYMQASPLGRAGAGLVALTFGDGTTSGTLDTATPSDSILLVAGTARREATGSEIWMDDVTGDGVADLLICRQNFTPDPERVGAGALTILKGGPELRELAVGLQTLDLAAPPPSVSIVTLVGPMQYDRLGIWTRTGDADGDGILDIVVGADQADRGSELNAGASFLVRGGAHLAASATFDLADTSVTALEGRVARIDPPAGANNYHLGGTCAIADLDGNGRADVLTAATINRAGATINPDGAPPGTAQASGGAPRGAFFVAWDDNFPPGLWPANYAFALDAAPGTATRVNGGIANRSFGEELVGGLDWDNDGAADVFAGDLVANAPGRTTSGMGYVLYDMAQFKGMTVSMDSPPAGASIVTIYGPSSGAIGSDTAAVGDFDGDGIGDLAVGSPNANPLGRTTAGVVHIFYGRDGEWPTPIDTAPGAFPPAQLIRIAEIRGALGTRPNPLGGTDIGDTLCYSASSGDANGDGKTDLLTNEMLGNGLAPTAVDVGNLLVLSGAALLPAPGETASLAEIVAFLLGTAERENRLDANADGAIDAADAADRAE